MKKIIGLMLGLVFSMAIFSGCGTSNNIVAPMYGEAAEIKIAVLGSEEQFKVRENFFVGMDLAINELKEEGIKISYDKINDDKIIDTGVALAKDIANDSTYTLAFTFQVDEVVEIISEFFNEAKKPLLILNENCEHTMERDYEYILSGVVSAEDASRALVKYCESHGLKWVATVHSETEYEIATAKEFNNTLNNNKNVQLVYSLTGPYHAGEVNNLLEILDTLGVQALYGSFDDLEWACELISYIKNRNKDMVILGDARFNNLEMINKYKDVLEGMIIAGSSGVASTEKLKEFIDRYKTQVKEEKGIDLNSVAAEAYDFVHMIAQSFKKSGNSHEFMKNMKSNEGYPGITNIKFDEKGNLDEEPDFWTIRNGQMQKLV